MTGYVAREATRAAFIRGRKAQADLGPHTYTEELSSFAFHACAHGDLSISIGLAIVSPYKFVQDRGGR